MTRKQTGPSIYDVCLPGFELTTATPKPKQLARNMQCELDRAKQLFEKTVKGIVIWSRTNELIAALALLIPSIPQLADDIDTHFIRTSTRTNKLRNGHGSLVITDCQGIFPKKNARAWLVKHPEHVLKCCIRHIAWDGTVTMIHHCSSHRPNPVEVATLHPKIGQKFGELTVVGYSPKPVGQLDPMHDIGEFRYVSSYPDLLELLELKEWGVQFRFGRSCTCVYTLHPDPTISGGGVAFRPADRLCTHCRTYARWHA
ncbi:hypothetical protein COY32_05345 [candidate division WWE3 bacterium CG_4_10_14_0_2_um_filter_41_14]|uniref:Uncharacterized protein n=1 Tax=candidate division WWE3 bacterium CG_4_10_14_0_2_um_filter_41_14 TaxID=1975072 RepID=A0A2M7TGR8_UNCKA|nr:MAG: hypothetical protein COY32_05345 [candidate division WWE3 bacterium CG_4_10_14_0_2_um_filter_41_14]